MVNLQQTIDTIKQSDKPETNLMIGDLDDALRGLDENTLKQVHTDVLDAIKNGEFVNKLNESGIQGVFNSRLKDYKAHVVGVSGPNRPGSSGAAGPNGGPNNPGNNNPSGQPSSKGNKPNRKNKKSKGNRINGLLSNKLKKPTKLNGRDKLKLSFNSSLNAISNYNKAKKSKKKYRKDQFDAKLDNIKVESKILFSEIENNILEKNGDFLLQHSLDFKQKSQKLKDLLDDALQKNTYNNDLRKELQKARDELEQFISQNDADRVVEDKQTETEIKQSKNNLKVEKAKIEKAKQATLQQEKTSQHKNNNDTKVATKQEESDIEINKSNNKTERAKSDLQSKTDIVKSKNNIKLEKSTDKKELAQTAKDQADAQKNDTLNTNTQVRQNTAEKQQYRHDTRVVKTETKADNLETGAHTAKQATKSRLKSTGKKTSIWTRAFWRSLFNRK